MDQDETTDVQEEAVADARLFVGGLAWAATDEDLKQAFEPYGTVVSCAVITNKETGRSKGFGFVEFETVDEASKAKEALDGQDIAGRPVKIDFARPRR